MLAKRREVVVPSPAPAAAAAAAATLSLAALIASIASLLALANRKREKYAKIEIHEGCMVGRSLTHVGPPRPMWQWHPP